MERNSTQLKKQNGGLTGDVKVMASDSFFDGVSDGSQGNSVYMTRQIGMKRTQLAKLDQRHAAHLGMILCQLLWTGEISTKSS